MTSLERSNGFILAEPQPEAEGLPSLDGASGADHSVQFYEDDDVLCDSVAHFLGVGLVRGEAVIVIATEAHREGLAARLARRGLSVEDACATGQLVWLDARETLAQFLVAGQPDWTLFSELLGTVLEQCRQRSRLAPVRAYGEMVDVLWRDGEKQAALVLEGMWNDLARRHAFSLLCSYVMGNFYRAGAADPFFTDVHRAHTHVVPDARIETPSASRRELGELKRHARALETELAHRKELEVELREAILREKKAREEAERSVHYNEMFAGMLGHDLRNPLSAIATGANYIARLNSSPKSTRAATRILSSATRMGRMIDQLLDFTRIRVGGGLALAPTRFDLAQVCDKVRDELEAAHPERAIVVDVAGDVVGEWDLDRLQQVLSNLVGNALHHGALGSAVRISCDGHAPERVVLSVHNDGVVGADVLPILFEPFRGNARYHRTRGLGLGLFITREIVAAHLGTIEVASDEHVGTTFQIHLPRVVRSSVTPPSPTAQS